MFNQPKGLLTIASTEMWERFSFYTMQFSLVLYAVASLSHRGLGFSDEKALQIVGIYGGLVYATPLIGGYLADKYIGRIRAVHLGGILMAIGHFVLALESVASFYCSLVFLAIGCGLFKPNITSLVGDLYTKEDSRRDAGYNLFYAAINVGALLSGFLGGILNDTFGYYASFAAAGVCMLVGVGNFFFYGKNLNQCLQTNSQSLQAKTPFKSLLSHEKKAVYLIVILSLVNIIWQIAYNQWAGTLNLYAERNTDRTIGHFTIPTIWFESLNSLFIVFISPLFAVMYTHLTKLKKEIPISYKLALGFFLQGLACFILLPAIQHIVVDAHYLASPWYQFFFYFFSTLAELFTMPVMYSLLTQLAPTEFSGRLMGFFTLTSLSAGNYLAGYVGSKASRYGDVAVFLSLGLVTCFCGFLFLLLKSPLQKKIQLILSQKEQSLHLS
jgi:POT family proton-dependent oligopeptide transporter